MLPWTTGDMQSQKGKWAVVTGATGGVGFECALALAAHGADVVLAGRNRGKGEDALSAIRNQVREASVRFELLDLASLQSVREFSSRMVSNAQPIDVLINNGAVMSLPQRCISADGFELQFATNHLGHFQLTSRLMPLLLAAPKPVVTTVSSLAHRRGKIDFDDLQAERRYSPWRAYQQSKLANLLFAFELQRKSDANDWHIVSNAAHPGYARTNIIANGPGDSSLFGRLSKMLLMPFMSHSAADGAAPILYAAVAPDAQPAGYYGPNGFYETKGPASQAYIAPRAKDATVAANLWAVSEDLIGEKFFESGSGTDQGPEVLIRARDGAEKN